MRAASRKRADTSEQACLACRKRKTRCIIQPGNTTCSYCIRYNKTCVFNGPPMRTPLTRKNLDDLETRCRDLEAQLSQLTRNATQPSHIGSTPSSVPGAIVDSRAPARSEGQSDIEQYANAFEWNERPHSTDDNSRRAADGMASLTVRNGGNGYLGSSSGSTLLETISSSNGGHSRLKTATPFISPIMTTNLRIPGLSTASNMTSSLVREHLIEAYFEHYNTSYPVLHKETFRQACGRRSSFSHDSIWHVIYFMVLAIGEWVSGFGDEDTSLFYDAARSRLTISVLEAGTMNVVQAFLLLSNYLQKTDWPNTAYNFLGIAYRVALGLGLHREISNEQIAETCALHQRRLIFWTLYSIDSGFSLTTGRPVLVADSFIDVKKPLNVDDSGCGPNSVLPTEVFYPTTSSSMVAQLRLAVIANKIHSRLLSVHGDPDVEHSSLIMEQALKDWRESLPAYFFTPDVPDWFRGPRAALLWKASNVHLVLLIASHKNHSDTHYRRKIGMKSWEVAVNSINDICDFCENYHNLLHHGLAWYVVYYTLQALLAIEAQKTFFGKNMISSNIDQFSPQGWPNTISRARQCLTEISQRSKPAARVLQFLDHIGDASQSRHDANQETAGEGPVNHTPVTEPQLLENQHDLATASNVRSEAPFAISNEAFDFLHSPYTSHLSGRNWMMAADPSLHIFMDETNDIGNIFDDLGGFPGANDGDNFSNYLNGVQF